MQQDSKEKLIKEYMEIYDAIPREALELDLRVTVRTMQALAEGNPVSPSQLADIWEMHCDQVEAILEQAIANRQVEVDENGDLVGAVLSHNQTDHQVSIGGNELYAWCAYDAIYAPGVVGKPARILSRDPVTGETIHVLISPDGVEEVRPESTVVSVVGAEMNRRAGPEALRCTQMLFFASNASAQRWLGGRFGISILTVEEVFEMANQFQIKPAKQLGLV